EQEVVLSDGSVLRLHALSPDELERAGAEQTLAAECYRTVQRLARECREEVEERFPRVLRRVGGYNLDEFTRLGAAFNLAKLIVGSEGTLAVILEAKLKLTPLPKAKAVLAIQFAQLLDALAATPVILRHSPSAVEVMDGFILGHTRQSAALQRLRESFIEGDPGGLLCVEFYDERPENLPPRIEALEHELASKGLGYRFHRAFEPEAQARIWSLREAALGLSMAMKEDAKSLSFVEDTAVAPEKLRDYIERFLAVIRSHGTTAGVYAHASVGCLHVRPVVNLKTEEGVRRFEAIASDVSDLVLEFGGALSGEHGDGLVRSPFLRKMFGPVLYEAFRTIKRTFDPDGILNPGKIVDPPPLTANLRFGAGYVTPDPPAYFDFSDYGGFGGAVEMCSGLGACRKKLDGTMCPSYMATLEEKHSTRGRANVLRLAMNGNLGGAAPDDHGVYEVLDLCLECRACSAECPVGVDVARFKSEFLARYWQKHGIPLSAMAMAHAHGLAVWGSRVAPLANRALRNSFVRRASERVFGIDRRRTLPPWSRSTFAQWARSRNDPAAAGVLLFNDTFTNYYDPEIGIAAWNVLEAGGQKIALAPNHCCGRPLISKGLLREAREQARRNASALYEAAAAGKPIVFCEPSCLSAVREDAPALLRGDERQRAAVVARASVLFEEFAVCELEAGRLRLVLGPGPPKILLHGHCHQKAMGLLPPAKALLARIPGTSVIDAGSGCCGMAGSFGYTRDHYEVSRLIGERHLFPQIREKAGSTIVVAGGTSCRQQIRDFTGEAAVHPAVVLHGLLRGG
ncbi:MAG TPA: FAD-linked oxidase C-terminal domain-containing protein, partial [Bryobacteraceae bacterium]|nr:FAD-linked oxidase C-terminal domain-containing protein [Bryobacteraceae bacterium]